MLILCDRKMPEAAMSKLSGYGEIAKFTTEGITYEAISGHPDIFFCKTPGGLIVAPNLPAKYFKLLTENSIPFVKGLSPVGLAYPESARYNSLVTEKYIFQNPETADLSIAKLNPRLEIISVKQGYVQCNLIDLANDSFITSDRGIEKSLKQHNLEVHFVNPSCVQLDGFEHGFFGGACGIHGNTLFICGSMHYFKNRKEIENSASAAGIKIVELHNKQPLDVGTILFV